MAGRSKIIAALLALLGSATGLQAQDSAGVRALSREAYLQIIRTYHPVARAAELDVVSARANLLRSQGVFDPQAGVGYRSKYLSGTEYYTYFSPGVTIPTWYGVELKAGVDDARGVYLDPETTRGALSYAGAKVVVNNIFLTCAARA